MFEKHCVSLFEGLNLHIGNFQIRESIQCIVILIQVFLTNFNQELFKGFYILLFILFKFIFKTVELDFSFFELLVLLIDLIIGILQLFLGFHQLTVIVGFEFFFSPFIFFDLFSHLLVIDDFLILHHQIIFISFHLIFLFCDFLLQL